MHKFFTLLVFILLITLALPALAKNPIEYDHNIKYQGTYKTDLLYIFHWKLHFWYVDERPIRMQNLKCEEAINALNLGTWTGNLSDNGKCIGHDEAPTRASGNYLNYLVLHNKPLAE